jgi:hypothetical protein
VAGVRVIVLLANGFATDVDARQFPALLSVARRDASDAQARVIVVLSNGYATDVVDFAL